jgi:hypothetical protein
MMAYFASQQGQSARSGVMVSRQDWRCRQHLSSKSPKPSRRWNPDWHVSLCVKRPELAHGAHQIRASFLL